MLTLIRRSAPIGSLEHPNQDLPAYVGMSLPLIDQPSTFAGGAGLIDIDKTFLPVGRMRQIARVTLLDETSIWGEVPIDPDHWVWEEHFPGDPIFPGTLIIEAAGQLVALWAGDTGNAAGLAWCAPARSFTTRSIPGCCP